MIESLIRQNNSANRPTVLGLATGSTPVGLYRELIRLHKEAGLDFSRVITFNLDEYYPMTPEDILDPSNHCWCRRTMQVIGPDGGLVRPQKCSSKRGCYTSQFS